MVLPVPGGDIARVVRDGREGRRVPRSAVPALLPAFARAEGGEGPAEVAVEVLDELVLRPMFEFGFLGWGYGVVMVSWPCVFDDRCIDCAWHAPIAVEAVLLQVGLDMLRRQRLGPGHVLHQHLLS